MFIVSDISESDLLAVLNKMLQLSSLIKWHICQVFHWFGNIRDTRLILDLVIVSQDHLLDNFTVGDDLVWQFIKLYALKLIQQPIYLKTKP